MLFKRCCDLRLTIYRRDDFMRALVGLFHTMAIFGWEQNARRFVDSLIAGSRPTADGRIEQFAERKGDRLATR